MYYYFCFDVEAFEFRKKRILEVGYSIIDADKKEISTHHIIVNENSHLRNGKYVSDNRDNFTHGESVFMDEQHLVELLDRLIFYADGIVGHALSNDVKYLLSMGVTIPEEIPRYDTQTIAKLVFGEQRKLERVYQVFCQKTLEDAHNAGNDSHATAEVFLEQLVINIVDSEENN